MKVEQILELFKAGNVKALAQSGYVVIDLNDDHQESQDESDDSAASSKEKDGDSHESPSGAVGQPTILGSVQAVKTRRPVKRKSPRSHILGKRRREADDDDDSDDDDHDNDRTDNYSNGHEDDDCTEEENGDSNTMPSGLDEQSTILGSEQVVQTRRRAPRRSKRIKTNETRKTETEVASQNCSTAKRKRGAPLKPLASPVKEFLRKSDKYKTLTGHRARTYRYYYNKKLTDKPFFRGMIQESRMRSQYLCWSRSLDKFVNNRKILLAQYRVKKTKVLRTRLQKLDAKINRRKAIMAVYENEGTRAAMEFKEKFDKANPPSLQNFDGLETSSAPDESDESDEEESSVENEPNKNLRIAINQFKKATRELQRARNEIEEKKTLLNEKIKVHQTIHGERQTNDNEINDLSLNKQLEIMAKQLSEASRNYDEQNKLLLSLQKKMRRSLDKANYRTVIMREIKTRFKLQLDNAEKYIEHLERATWNRREKDLQMRTEYCHKQNFLEAELQNYTAELSQL